MFSDQLEAQDSDCEFVDKMCVSIAITAKLAFDAYFVKPARTGWLWMQLFRTLQPNAIITTRNWCTLSYMSFACFKQENRWRIKIESLFLCYLFRNEKCFSVHFQWKWWVEKWFRSFALVSGFQLAHDGVQLCLHCFDAFFEPINASTDLCPTLCIS